MEGFSDVLQPGAGTPQPGPQGFGEVVNPGFQPSPPASPEEANQRKAGWMQVFDTLKTDPNAQRALMHFGTTMLQGRMPGQSLASQVADAGQVGFAAYDMGRIANSEQERAQREEARKNMESNSIIGLRSAQTEDARFDTETKRKTQGSTIEKAMQDAKFAKNRAELEAIKVQTEQELVSAGMPLKEAKAKVTQALAAAGASYASARENNAQASTVEQHNRDLGTLTPGQRLTANSSAKTGGLTAHQQFTMNRNMETSRLLVDSVEQQAAAAGVPVDKFIADPLSPIPAKDYYTAKGWLGGTSAKGGGGGEAPPSKAEYTSARATAVTRRDAHAPGTPTWTNENAKIHKMDALARQHGF